MLGINVKIKRIVFRSSRPDFRCCWICDSGHMANQQIITMYKLVPSTFRGFYSSLSIIFVSLTARASSLTYVSRISSQNFDIENCCSVLMSGVTYVCFVYLQKFIHSRRERGCYWITQYWTGMYRLWCCF